MSAPLTRERFARGALHRVFDQEITTGESYFVLMRAADAERPGVRALSDWLMAEFGQGAAPQSAA